MAQCRACHETIVGPDHNDQCEALRREREQQMRTSIAYPDITLDGIAYVRADLVISRNDVPSGRDTKTPKGKKIHGSSSHDANARVH